MKRANLQGIGLLEFEVGRVLRSVAQHHIQHTARSGPALIGLPDVGIGVAGGVVAQAAAACRQRFFDQLC